MGSQGQLWKIERVSEVVDGPVITGMFDEHRVSITPDGRTWIRKRVMTTGCQPLVAEATCWLLATELDLWVPPAAVFVSSDENETSWLSQEITPMLHWNDGEASDIENIEALGGILVLDTLTLNNDRHSGNLIVTPHSDVLHLWGIDSGNALVGWPSDFDARRAEFPDPSVVPVRRFLGAAHWKAICAEAANCAEAVKKLPASGLAAIVDEACDLGREPDAKRILDVLLERQANIVDLSTRYLEALQRTQGAS